jgi:repressor LexA
MAGISPRRQQIVEFIRNFVEEHGYPPTVRDIQNGCDISSTSVVDFHLRTLEREGHLRRDFRVSRGMELLGGSAGRRETVTVPLVGQIAAGEPVPVPQAGAWDTASEGESLELPSELVHGDNVYALKVKGTSMVDALINDGDVVLMQQVNRADDGDMVAVWLKDDKTVTLKKIYRERGRIRLQPANATMKPIYSAPDNVEVQGRVVGVIRTY